MNRRVRCVKVFFLVCLIVAAIYGAWPLEPRILFVRGSPAILALLIVPLVS